MDRSSLALVTGGTGFLGTHLVHRLVEEGVRVRVLARAPHSPSPTGAHGGGRWPWGPDRVETVAADVRDADAVARAARGADRVYHLAARARGWAPEAGEFESVNVRGTRNVCVAARDAGASLLHVSTALVAPPGSGGDAPPASRGNGGDPTALTPYQRTKARGERVVERFIARGLDGAVVRPTRVFGPGPLNEANSVTRLIDLYRRGLFRFRIADGDARANYAYVADVVDGIVRAARRGRPGARYVLAGENLTLPGFLERIARASGRSRRVVALPRAVARAVALGCEGLARIGVEPLITREWVELLSVDWPVRSGRSVEELGYAPLSADEGIRRTLSWLDGHGTGSAREVAPPVERWAGA